jgi:tRNA dimethylallyltransferase
MQKIPVIAIVGPTAIGKSSLAVYIAKKIKGEVISADSRQVYKGMDIGTGKITKKEMGEIAHHMLNISSPKKRISVQEYIKQASPIIESISKRGHVPIVCGGTGFYVEELLFPSSLAPVSANKKLRQKLSKLSAEKLFSMLKKKDPRRAKNIDMKNKVRLIRALEIIEAIGKVPKRIMRKNPSKVLMIELDAPLDFIRKKVHIRLQKRIKQGLINEGKKLLKTGLSFKEMESFGLEYKWLALLLQNKINKKEFEIGLEKDIVKYVRRQKTWFNMMRKKHNNILAFDAQKESTIKIYRGIKMAVNLPEFKKVLR